MEAQFLLTKALPVLPYLEFSFLIWMPTHVYPWGQDETGRQSSLHTVIEPICYEGLNVKYFLCHIASRFYCQNHITHERWFADDIHFNWKLFVCPSFLFWSLSGFLFSYIFLRCQGSCCVSFLSSFLSPLPLQSLSICVSVLFFPCFFSLFSLSVPIFFSRSFFLYSVFDCRVVWGLKYHFPILSFH